MSSRTKREEKPHTPRRDHDCTFYAESQSIFFEAKICDTKFEVETKWINEWFNKKKKKKKNDTE